MNGLSFSPEEVKAMTTVANRSDCSVVVIPHSR